MTHSWIYIAALIKLYARRNELNSVCEGPRCALPFISLYRREVRDYKIFANDSTYLLIKMNSSNIIRNYFLLPEKLLGEQLGDYTARKRRKYFR
jgi:hypothetical protein